MLLAVLFFLVALVYSSVGFGGGSSYIALLYWQGVPAAMLPLLALACNLIVSGIAFVHFARSGHFPWWRSLPFLALSLPASYLGGLFPVQESTYLWLLAASLTVAGCLLLIPLKDGEQPVDSGIRRIIGLMGPLLGAGLGFLSGVVGIGGGIFLAPVLHLCRWATAKQVAALAAGFIFVNSAAGMSGQLQKHGWTGENMGAYLVLPAAVLAGALIGSRCGCTILGAQHVRQITGGIILLVAGNLWANFF
jgi:uncharacterized membrane protein YfcA